MTIPRALTERNEPVKSGVNPDYDPVKSTHRLLMIVQKNMPTAFLRISPANKSLCGYRRS